MIEVSTGEYEFTHGKKPRGRGGWAFSFKRNASIDEIFWCNGTYAEAKKQARARAKAEGKSEIFVCS